MAGGRVSSGDLLRLKRVSTPTLFNGWEQVSRHDRRNVVNRGEVRDFMPGFGPMVGRAVTLVVQPSEPGHLERRDAPAEYRAYVASVPGPKILVIKDLDAPDVIGTYVGEVNSSLHRALGCVGIVTDGGVRDLQEMTSLGFKALAARLCVGHAYAWPVRWNCEVEVFGCTIRPGQLLHADQHGFLAVPADDEDKLIDAAQFMDGNECDTVIPASQLAYGRSMEAVQADLRAAEDRFRRAAAEKFGRAGEW